MDASETQVELEVAEDTEEKALFEKLLHGPKVARILGKVAEKFGFDADEAKADFEALWIEDSGRVRVPRELSDEQIEVLRAFVADQSKGNKDAAKAILGVKADATLNSLVIKHASRIIAG